MTALERLAALRAMMDESAENDSEGSFANQVSQGSSVLKLIPLAPQIGSTALRNFGCEGGRNVRQAV